VVAGPLQGLRVLDLTRFVSGSYATMVLASLGADVIKIETGEGDPYRTLGPHALEDETALFLSLNTGKRSLDVDFRTPEGRAIIEQLLGGSDFFVENSRPGASRRMDSTTSRCTNDIPRSFTGRSRVMAKWDPRRCAEF